MDQRFTIKVSPWWRPLLALFGATPGNSWVEVGDRGITALFGWYRLTIPWDNVEGAEPATWPWYGGIGWRSDLRKVLGLIGATSPVIRIRLRAPMRTRLLGLPARFRELYVSLEDPSGFLAAVADHLRTVGERASTSPGPHT